MLEVPASSLAELLYHYVAVSEKLDVEINVSAWLYLSETLVSKGYLLRRSEKLQAILWLV